MIPSYHSTPYFGTTYSTRTSFAPQISTNPVANLARSSSSNYLQPEQVPNLPKSSLYVEEDEVDVGFRNYGVINDNKIPYERRLELLKLINEYVDCFMAHAVSVYERFLTRGARYEINTNLRFARANLAIFLEKNQFFKELLSPDFGSVEICNPFNGKTSREVFVIPQYLQSSLSLPMPDSQIYNESDINLSLAKYNITNSSLVSLELKARLIDHVEKFLIQSEIFGRIGTALRQMNGNERTFRYLELKRLNAGKSLEAFIRANPVLKEMIPEDNGNYESFGKQKKNPGDDIPPELAELVGYVRQPSHYDTFKNMDKPYARI